MLPNLRVSPFSKKKRFWGDLFFGVGLAAPLCLCYGLASGIVNDLTQCPIWIWRGFVSSGEKIFFVSDLEGKNEVYIMNADGSSQTNITQNPADDRSPIVSPDGKKIAFASNRSGNYQIYVMNLDGTEITNLSKNKSQEGGDPANGGSLWLFYGKPV